MQQKNMHFLNEYIIFSCEAAGIRKQIDNGKLFAHYRKIYIDTITAFNKSHPVFWMHLMADKDIKARAESQLATIKKCLSECLDESFAVMDYLNAKIKTFDVSLRSTEMAFYYHLYQEFGPAVLETIRRYEAVIDRIKQLERAAISWLKDIEATKDQPPKSNLFKRIPVQQREVIRRYLQEQNAKEAAIKREADRAAAEAVAALVAAQKKLKKDKIRASKLAAQEKEQAEPLSGGSSSSSSYMVATPQPKIKIKTRPSAASGASAAAASIIEDDEKSDEDTQEFMLPPQLRNDAFKALIKSLKDETNERRLKQLVIRLNKEYGIFVETDEKKNKGYFAVRSPITNQLHVRTYHHLHNDNPYGSIFIALRDVLQAADLR